MQPADFFRTPAMIPAIFDQNLGTKIFLSSWALYPYKFLLLWSIVHNKSKLETFEVSGKFLQFPVTPIIVEDKQGTYLHLLIEL